MQATENKKERDGQSWRPSPTGLLAGGANAPYERFAASKTSAQAEFTSAEHLDHRRVERANGLRNSKKKHLQSRCFFFWKGRLKSIFPSPRKCRPQGGPQPRAQRSGSRLEAKKKHVRRMEKSLKAFFIALGLFLSWCARRDLNPHVRNGH